MQNPDYSPARRVYFIQGEMTGLVKIGLAWNVSLRLSQLQVGSPDVLRLLKDVGGGAEYEAELHARFAHLRQHGEWFKLDSALAALCDVVAPPASDPPGFHRPLPRLDSAVYDAIARAYPKGIRYREIVRTLKHERFDHRSITACCARLERRWRLVESATRSDGYGRWKEYRLAPDAPEAAGRPKPQKRRRQHEPRMCPHCFGTFTTLERHMTTCSAATHERI